MATTTTNISLTKPEATDITLIREDINANSDIIDGRFSSTYMAVQAKASVDIDGGSITGITDLLVADGGTGASTLTDGGVLLGSGTSAITAMAVLANSEMIVGNGTTDPVAESGATLRASIGVTIGTNVQAFDNALTSISGLTYVSGSFIALTANDTYTVRTYAQVLSDIGAMASGTVPTTITIADESADTTCFPLFVTAATGDLAPKSATGLTFNASTDVLSATGFSGPLTGNVTGNCSGSSGTCTGEAATVATITGLAPDTATTQATQAAITSAANLATIGTVTSGTLSTGAVLADVTMTLGSDADGDIYYRASNKLTRLVKGAATNVLTMNAGATAPEWAADGGYTNLTSFVAQTAFRVFYSNTDGDVTELALGADGTYLKSNGAAANPSFGTPAGAGDVSKVGTPVDSQVGVWTGDGTIEGAASFTYDGSNLQITGDVGATGSRITKGWFANLETTGDLTVNGTALASTYATLGANTNITSILNAALYVGRDADNQIKFATDNNIVFRLNGADGALFGATGELDMNANSIGFTQQTVTYASGTTTADWTNGNKAIMTFGAGNITTFAFTNPTNPCNLVLKMVQDGTGSRVVSAWDADIKWADGTAPTLTTGANTIDICSFYWDGTNYFGVASLAFS